MTIRFTFLSAFLVCSAPSVLAQQVADTAFVSTVFDPAFPEDKGPLVLIDEAHHNFHTADGRYLAFAMLLRADGYRVRGLAEPFTRSSLEGAALLVISNALHEDNVEDWYLPTPSAFTDEEVEAVRAWVEDGGALFLIADHMPCAGAAETLADAFGLAFQNGFAMHRESDSGRMRFSQDDGSLVHHVVLEGRGPDERVPFVVSFTGQAFRATRQVDPILVVPEGVDLLLPEIAWNFSKRTPRISAGGLLQGALLRQGDGRVAAFGEAAMFTAQKSNGNRMGMNDPEAPHNRQFALNVVRWLTGVLD